MPGVFALDPAALLPNTALFWGFVSDCRFTRWVGGRKGMFIVDGFRRSFPRLWQSGKGTSGL